MELQSLCDIIDDLDAAYDKLSDLHYPVNTKMHLLDQAVQIKIAQINRQPVVLEQPSVKIKGDTMSAIKRMYEEHFDELITYEDLKNNGLSEEEIREQWESFSEKTWEEFAGISQP